METALETKQYPTNPDAEGWLFETEEDESFGIKTKVDNGDTQKKVVLSNGKIAIVKELIGDEIMTATKMVGKNESKDNSAVIKAMMCLAIKLHDDEKSAGKIIPMEDIGKMKGKDYTKLMAAYSALNF